VVVATTTAHGAVAVAATAEKNTKQIREKVQEATDAFGLPHFLLDNL